MSVYGIVWVPLYSYALSTVNRSMHAYVILC